MRRHAIPDGRRERIEGMLPGKAGGPGVTAGGDRLFVNAVPWIGEAGVPWRGLPERLGKRGPARRRPGRWAREGVWAKAFETLRGPGLERPMLDSSVIRAHPHAAGAGKSGAARGAGRSGPSGGAGAASGRRPTRRRTGRATP